MKQHRRKLGVLILAVGAAAVGSHFLRQLPTDTHIRYELGPDHANVEEVRVAFARGDEVTVRSMSRRFPEGAPETFEDTVALTPGRYRVHVMIRTKDGDVRAFFRGLDLPQDGVVRVDLFERAFAYHAP